MFSLLGGVFLGWSLGANDAANVFGAAVYSKMLKFRSAVLLASGFVVLGAVISGQAGIDTLNGLTQFNLNQAVISSVAAAVTVTLMTVLKLPVSTSQAVVGSIIGIGILNHKVNLGGLSKVIACWVGTPIGAAIIALILHQFLAQIYNRLNFSIFKTDILLRLCLIITGSYGAYVLGANNVANVTAVFVGAGLLNVFSATLIGGISIAFGILTYSRPVMKTVGNKLVKLDPFSAVVVVLALATTLHVYTLVGVPVSSSQAVVGGVLGVGIIKGVKTIRIKTLLHILAGWSLTPIVSCLLSLGIYFGLHLNYVP